jgi:cysteine-rich repeat protein
MCSDGIIAGNENCDDMNTMDGDGCDGMCNVETGYSCQGSPSACTVVCGDGLVVGSETCDDGNPDSGDGCSETCAPEAGFTCTGLPSVCTTTCGDGVIAGLEACDDGDIVTGDGCDTNCAIESGYVCENQPSDCSTVCGDNIKAGTELCDDGNLIPGDGCSDTCSPNTGETCADPLVQSQATVNGGQYVWIIPEGGVTGSEGAFSCDPNSHGPDVVIAYTKTSDTLANGGSLLHINADTSKSATSQYLNVEVKAAGCDAGQGSSIKCLWYKHDWDIFLDVPPGTYHVWVGKNSPASSSVLFPPSTVMIEEINAADAEGEGCFAPYTETSSIYTPPSGAGQPHTWQIPPGINSFDMGPTWGEPTSISCDNTPVYGDIHGVDTVIEFNKISPTSVLKIDAQNLASSLASSDLNLEVMNVCDSSSLSRITRNCRANQDTISITAPSPAGPVYLWLSTEATSEEFGGAEVQVTEIFPGVGESWPTAQPLTGSSTITPTSSQRLDVPTCFAATGNIHWYSYTLTNNAFNLSANTTGTVAIYDESGQELGCTSNASTDPLGFVASPGKTFYIGVPSGGAVTALTIGDLPYTGIKGTITDMEVSFPVSPLTEYGMAIGASEIYMGGTTQILSIPKVIGATAVAHAAGDGLTATHLGYDLVWTGASLFSVDSTTSTSANRLFQVFNGTAWGPVAWDLTPTYPGSSPSHAITFDGANVLMSTRRTSTDANFYSVSPSAAGTPTLLGTNTSVWYVTGMAADSQYFYVASNGLGGEGVYRLLRSNISAAATKIATINTGTLCNNIELDSLVNPQNLYVRNADGDVHAVLGPASSSPIHVGVVVSLGTASDYAMSFDRAAGSMYLFETESVTSGRIIKVD